jgi:hypothetical protein
MDLQYALTLVRQNGNRIQLVPEEARTEEIRLAALRRTPTAIEHLSNPSQAEQEVAIATQGGIDREGIFELVALIPGVSQAVLDRTLDVNGNCINLIESPTEDQLVRAVRTDGDAIKHIPNPSVKLQEIAIAASHSNMKFVADPDTAVVSAMLKANPRSVEFIANPEREHQQFVLRELPDDGLHYLNHVDDDIAFDHIKDNPDQIRLLRNQTEECCWAALTVSGEYIKDIRNPTPEMESYARLVSDGN